MTKGAVALVLHAHLPYVRSAKPGSLEEDWFFQALIECYLPLLEALEEASSDPNQHPKLTIGLSPTLLSLLSDQDLKQRFPQWLNDRLALLPKADPALRDGAEHLAAAIKRHKRAWQDCDGDLIQRFAALQRQEVVDLLTCGATHGYLPLLRHHPEAVRGQLRTAGAGTPTSCGERPLGICCWNAPITKARPLDARCRTSLRRTGCPWAAAWPAPAPLWVYAPICSRNGVAFRA